MASARPETHRAALVTRLRAAGCVFAEEEADLLLEDPLPPAELEARVARRVSGLPLEQVLGWAELCGLRVLLDPGVFVPRRRTGLLVEHALSGLSPGAVVVDLCCGSGAIGAVLAARAPGVHVVGVEVDPAAVRNARRNLEPVGGQVLHGDLYSALPEDLLGRVEVLVCCPPYVPSRAVPMLPREARLHESPTALDGGADGLAVTRRVVAGAARWLAPGARVVLECGEDQSEEVLRLVSDAGLLAWVVRDPELGAVAVVARSHLA